MAIKFDVKRIKVVKTEEVRPNTWNPKEKDTKEFQKIKRGIALKGQRLPIIVRQVVDVRGERDVSGYEIVDGEQRFTACQQLGFKEVLIYNEGYISDQEAKGLTIWYQQQVDFNEIQLAGLVKELVQDDNFELPFGDDEVDRYLEMEDFDWDKYNSDKEESEGEEGRKHSKVINCPHCGESFEI